MKTLIAMVVCLLATEGWTLSDVKPADSSQPVLLISVVELGWTPKGPVRFNDLGQPIAQQPSPLPTEAVGDLAPHSWKILAKGPQIPSLKKITLNKDGKGVTIVLSDEDQKALSELTEKFQGEYLWFSGPGTDAVFIHITAPTGNGTFEFSPTKSKESGSIAESLRKRFRLGEFGK
ncbi:MAG: hypothetical protein ACREFF_06020 [Candidatus Udaeobacter sp.]